MLKVKVKILKDSNWQDMPWEPQFEVKEGDEIQVSPNLAYIMTSNGYAELGQGFKKDTSDPETKKPEDYPLDGIGLSAAIVGKLQQGGIKTVPELVEKTAAEILEFDGVGQGKVDDIQVALEKLGFSLKAVEGEE